VDPPREEEQAQAQEKFLVKKKMIKFMGSTHQSVPKLHIFVKMCTSKRASNPTTSNYVSCIKLICSKQCKY